MDRRDKSASALADRAGDVPVLCHVTDPRLGEDEGRAPGYSDYRKGCGELVIMGSRPAAVSNCGWAAGGTWAATPAISVG